jgi:hypothetical protein
MGKALMPNGAMPTYTLRGLEWDILGRSFGQTVDESFALTERDSIGSHWLTQLTPGVRS